MILIRLLILIPYPTMTGPAEGKIPLSANVFLAGKRIAAIVYIHLKGYALARVTHLDIESPKLNLGLGKERKGDFFSIHGIDEGIQIPQLDLIVSCPRLSHVLNVGYKTRAWVGQKEDGIYIGFKKEHIIKLEKIAKTLL